MFSEIMKLFFAFVASIFISIEAFSQVSTVNFNLHDGEIVYSSGSEERKLTVEAFSFQPFNIKTGLIEVESKPSGIVGGATTSANIKHRGTVVTIPAGFVGEIRLKINWQVGTEKGTATRFLRVDATPVIDP